MANYPFKVNEFIEEDVPIEVTTPVYDPKTKKVELKKETQTFKQKTYYSDSPPKKIVCNEHTYVCVNKGRYLFQCTKCDWRRFALPVSFKFDPDTGVLTRRNSNIRV